jgi:hypothetical protein
MDENVVTNVSASSSKWEDIFVSYESENLKDLSAYRLVSMAIINSILENGVGSECKTGQLNMRKNVQCLRGWASKLFLSCTSFGLNKNYFTSLTLENGQYEVNLRSVYALRCIGKGHHKHASTSRKSSTLQ